MLSGVAMLAAAWFGAAAPEASQLPPEPPAADAGAPPVQRVDCLWAGLGETARDQVVAIMADEASTIDDFERARQTMVPAGEACIEAGAWTRDDQVDLTFRDAFTRASMASDAAALVGLGIDPQAVLALWEQIAPRERDLLARYYDLSQSDQDAVTEWLVGFLMANGPAREAPARGFAATLLVSHAQLAAYAEAFAAPPEAP